MTRSIVIFRTFAAIGAMACSACALPQSAPIASKVEEAGSPSEDDYFIVPVLPPIVKIMGNRREFGFPAAFRLGGYRPSIALKPGDIISVTIFEVGGTPTFGSLPSRERFAQADRKNQKALAQSVASVYGSAPAGTVARMSPVLPNYAFNAVGFSRLPDSPKKAILLASIGETPLLVAQGGTPAPVPTPPVPATPTPASPQPAQPSVPLAPPSVRTLPPLTVEESGDVFIPYGGEVNVAGLTPIRAAEAIRQSISSSASHPQVVVSFISNTANIATVGGEANRPGPVTLTLRGERLLDVIGQAGGSKWPAPDTDVDILRSGRSAHLRLQTILDEPSENIVTRPNDEIFLTHNPRSFTVLGASQKVSQYTFDVPRVSLAEAVGRAGGAIDTVGNPAAIYLFREEPTNLAAEVLQTSAALNPPDPDRQGASLDPRRVKLVYKINMNSGEGYFLARRITMVDKDVVLIANAEGTQLLKLFTLVRGVTGAANDLNVFGSGGPLGRTAAR